MLHVDENAACFCKDCQMWLQPTQLEDHKIGRKHRKNVRRRGLPPRCWNSYAGDEGNRKQSPPKKKLLASAYQSDDPITVRCNAIISAHQSDDPITVRCNAIII